MQGLAILEDQPSGENPSIFPAGRRWQHARNVSATRLCGSSTATPWITLIGWVEAANGARAMRIAQSRMPSADASVGAINPGICPGEFVQAARHYGDRSGCRTCDAMVDRESLQVCRCLASRAMQTCGHQLRVAHAS